MTPKEMRDPPVDPPGSGEPTAAGCLDVLHVDMDCFFAAVEALDDPSLTGRPVIVGGTGTRGVVASCSYEARATGVCSAMPMTEARRRCPGAVVIQGRHDRYGEVSRQLHDVLRTFTPVIEPIAFDEAFLDVSGSHSLFGPSRAIAWSIRSRVREELALDCSVGVARSKLIAKLASREAKPRATPGGRVAGAGVVVITATEELPWLHPRSVSDLWGVGPRTTERLGRYGIRTIGDLAFLDEASLVRLVGRAAGRQLYRLARAEDRRPVVADRAVKSIGHEETFGTDRYDFDSLHTELVRLADSVGGRLRSAGVVGRTVTLKVRFGDFTTITRSHSLSSPLQSSAEIGEISSALLAGVELSRGVRLIGITVSSLETGGAAPGRQLELLALDSAGQQDDRHRALGEVDAAVDAIRKRYGTSAVGSAAVVGSGGVRVKALGDTAWGPAAVSEAPTVEAPPDPG
jgi:DNA polymerase-4